MNDTYSIGFKVRDYECDSEGIVNNANYMHYFEMARNEHLEHLGFDYQKLVDAGVNIVLRRAEIDYISPLKGRDDITVTCRVERVSPLRIVCHQEIIRDKDKKQVARGKITVTCINREGRPFEHPILDNIAVYEPKK